jgi:Pyruvate/2-oxoacid:ferredoxin oxidoreductase delta subunit
MILSILSILDNNKRVSDQEKGLVNGKSARVALQASCRYVVVTRQKVCSSACERLPSGSVFISPGSLIQIVGGAGEGTVHCRTFSHAHPYLEGFFQDIRSNCHRCARLCFESAISTRTAYTVALAMYYADEMGLLFFSNICPCQAASMFSLSGDELGYH